ncbi:MAG TPA: ScpA family protein [Alphaproteobacteria bacterium]
MAEADAPEPFDLGHHDVALEDKLVLDLESFEGPIDLLLALARQQKVDLTRISMLALADQYLDFIARARRLDIELAADYLVMAAWLTYLKSRLLLPEPPAEEGGPSGPELAEALTFQLRRLEAMQKAGAGLMRLPRLGYDVFPRGAPEGVEIIRIPVWQSSLYDLLKAYGDARKHPKPEAYQIAPTELYSMTEALERIAGMLGRMADWQNLMNLLPRVVPDGLVRRSAVAATLLASLELARLGEMQIRQPQPFGPIYVRRTPAPEEA